MKSSTVPATSLTSTTWPLLVVVAGHNEAKANVDLSLLPPHFLMEMQRPPNNELTYFEFLHRARPSLNLPTEFPLTALRWDPEFSKFQPLTPASFEYTLNEIMKAVVAGTHRNSKGIRGSCYISLQVDFQLYQKCSEAQSNLILAMVGI